MSNVLQLPAAKSAGSEFVIEIAGLRHGLPRRLPDRRSARRLRSWATTFVAHDATVAELMTSTRMTA
jgi:hypothetical protein